jgi:hypothetical protein
LTSNVVRLLSAVAVAFATAAPSSVRGQPAASAFQLLDVPYVPQSLELCGGAAAAMVMRYWGATGIYAETFEDLVDEAARGIRGTDLIRALEDRGWQAIAVKGDAPLIRRSLDERRPPIALIEDRPGRFHYVVIVGWHERRVVLHDPARAPFRIIDEDAFIRAWSRSDFWTLLALPRTPEHRNAGRNPDADDVTEPPAALDDPCGGMVAEGVRLAHTGALDHAQDLLELASRRCPRAGAPWRELAGVHAVRKEWGSAARAARHAVERDSQDAHAAAILATSLFLEGDAAGALDAWNRIGEPRIDLLDVRGLARTRFDVAAGALGLRPQTVLTSTALRRGAQRLEAVPAVGGARVTYAPADGGDAQVTATIVERPMVPATRIALAAGALRAAVDREVRVEVASPTGSGELWHAGWRWWEARPRVTGGLAAPSPFGGVWSIEAAGERQTYANGSGRFEERHARVALGMSDWATGAVRWDAGLAIEEWSGGRALAVAGGLEYRLAGQRVTLAARAASWSGVPQTWLGSTSVLWRSRIMQHRTVWIVHGGFDAVGENAPFGLWPGAGTGQGRKQLLRAHPLLQNGVIGGGVLGRQLAYATIEWRRWSRPLRGVVRVAPAAFVDGARAWRVGDLGDGQAHADVGGGIRISVPGTGIMRIDVARGLRDGRSAVSVGWSP